MEKQETGVMLLVEAAGGVMRHVIDLYKGLCARNWRVRLVLSPLRIDSRYTDELGGLAADDLVYIPMHRAPHPVDLAAYTAITNILEKTRGETLLHAHSTKAGMIGSLLHSKVRASVFTPHAYRGVDPTASWFARRLLRVAERAYSKDYDRIIAVAPAEMEYARSLGIGNGALRCIPNGLDTSGVAFDEVEARRRRSPEGGCLGFVGRLVHQKNPLLFIEVLAEVARRRANARAIIIGDGPLREEMLRLAERHGIAGRIEWRGAVPASGSLREMDVMVHTSLYEGLPYTLIEACAELLPVVATSNHGSEALLRARLPHSIAPDAKASTLAGMAIALLEDDRLRSGQFGVMTAIAKEYSTETMISRIEAEYRSLAR